MAQAEVISITSRRKFLAGAALASAAIVAPVASATSSAKVAPVAVNPELTALSEDLFEARNELEEQFAAARKALDYVAAWDAANPEPRRVNDDGEENPDHTARVSQRLAARTVMLRQSGKKKALAAHFAAIQRFTAIADEVCEFAAVTMEDIVFKAWMSEVADTDDQKIAGSVVGDLLDLKQFVADASRRV